MYDTYATLTDLSQINQRVDRLSRDIYALVQGMESFLVLVTDLVNKVECLERSQHESG